MTEPQTIWNEGSGLCEVDALTYLRQAVRQGTPWYLALLRAIACWQLPEETVGDRHYRYLIGNEAFDWLLLAERLAAEIADFIPAEEYEALLFFGRLPVTLDETEFRRLIGSSKYRAHLNYLYGVTLEEALQLVVEEELHKEERSNVWRSHRSPEDLIYLHIYGKDRSELLTQFFESRGLPPSDTLAFGEWKEFTYWLFKYRLRVCDPARVASDTRKALVWLSRMETLRLRQNGHHKEELVIDADCAYRRLMTED